jgi:hypothetical protein
LQSKLKKEESISPRERLYGRHGVHALAGPTVSSARSSAFSSPAGKPEAPRQAPLPPLPRMPRFRRWCGVKGVVPAGALIRWPGLLFGQCRIR